MSSHGSQPPPSGIPDPSYTDADINLPVLAKWVGIMFAVTFLIIIMVLWLQRFLINPPANTKFASERVLPPENEPRLQVVTSVDLEVYHAEQAARLHTLEFIDAEKKIIRIPIEQAMQRLVETKALPHRAPEVAP